MRCEYCGYEHGEGTFCAHCGTPYNRELHDRKRDIKNESYDFKEATVEKANSLQSLGQNEKVQQAAEISKQYFSFFIKALIRPYQTMQKIQPEHALHSYITMSIISVLTALFSILVLNRVSFGYGVSFIDGFIRPLLFTGITLLVGLGIVYGITKLFNVTTNWKHIAAGYGTLLVPSAAAILLANLLFIIHLTSFSLFLMGIAFLIAFIAVNMSIFTHPVLQASHRTIDITYVLIIANVIMFYLIYKIVSSVVLSVFSGMFGSFF